MRRTRAPTPRDARALAAWTLEADEGRVTSHDSGERSRGRSVDGRSTVGRSVGRRSVGRSVGRRPIARDVAREARVRDKVRER